MVNTKPNLPILNIIIPLRFGFIPDEYLQRYLDQDPSIKSALQAAKAKYGHPNIHKGTDRIMKTFSAKTMIERVFTDAEDIATGKSGFSPIISADWNRDFSITVRIRSNSSIPEVAAYLEAYNYMSLTFTDETMTVPVDKENGWRLYFAGNRIFGETTKDDGRPILIAQERPVSRFTRHHRKSKSKSKSKSKRTSRRVTRKKSRGVRP